MNKHTARAFAALVAIVVVLGLGAGTASAKAKSERQVDDLYTECKGTDANPIVYTDEDGSFTCMTKDGKYLTCNNQGDGTWNCWQSRRQPVELKEKAPDNAGVAPTEPTKTSPRLSRSMSLALVTR